MPHLLAGKSNARYCLLLGINPTDYNVDWPELKANLEVLTPSEAKMVLRILTKRPGSFYLDLKSPFIGAICNCDRDCLAYSYQVGSDLLELMFKADIGLR